MIKTLFKRFLTDQTLGNKSRYSIGTINSFMSSLVNENFKDILTKRGLSDDIFQINDVSILKAVYEEVSTGCTVEAQTLKNRCHGACTSALREYVDFLRKYKLSIRDKGQTFDKLPKGRKSVNCANSFFSTLPSSSLQQINGIDILASIIPDIRKHMLEYSFFFSPESVKELIKEMNIHEILKKNSVVNQKLPVRYSTKLQYWSGNNLILDSNRGKNEASKYTNIDDYCADGGPHLGRYCTVQVDKDGNYAVRSNITKYSGHRVSCGKDLSTITYYTISHVWGETYDPLFFSSLWNVVLVPSHCSSILDKDDSSSIGKLSSITVESIKNTYKALCYFLYLKDNFSDEELNELFKFIPNDDPRTIPSDILEYAKNCINNEEGYPSIQLNPDKWSINIK